MAPGRSHRAASAAHKSLKEPDGDDSWDDSDEEDKPKPARAGVKRKAPSRASGGGQNGAADGQPQPAKQRRIKQAVDMHDLTLLEIILHHSGALDAAVKEWIERYKANKAAAAAELMTLLVKVCGVDEEELTEEDVDGGEVDALAQRLTAIVQEEGGGNVFTHTRQGRQFAAHYCMFWDKVLRSLAAADLLFDDFELNDKLTRLVTALNISVVRPFRHAAALTAAQLISSWIAVSKGLAASRNLTQNQLDAEERKKKGKSSNQQVINGLRRTLERCHARVEDLRNFRSVLFSGVFSHRFRDVSEEIRSIVIEAIGGWVEELPSEFLGDSYLKYLAWALSDRAPMVRLQAVKALTSLYSNSDHVPRLHEFTLRFTPRFCELMHDVDVEVAAAGLRLLALLVEHGIIKHQDVAGVYLLLAMPSPELRSAAAGLVVNLLEDQGKEAVEAAAERLKAAAQPAHTAAPAPKSKGRGSKSKAAQQAATSGADAAAAAAAAAAEAMLEDSNKLKLAGLLAVMGKLASAEPFTGTNMSPGELRSQAQMSQANAQQHGQAAAASSGSSSSSAAAALPTLQQADVKRVVEALWEHLYSVLSDVRSLTACLAEDSAVDLWGKVGTAHLASLIAAAAHTHIFGGSRASKGRKGRFGRGKAAEAAEGSTADEDAQQEVTVLMMQQLPDLLTTYQAEPYVVAPLLAIPRLLRLDLYLLRGAAESYRSLLTKIDGLLQRHHQPQLLVEAAGALVYASSQGPEALQEVGCQVLATACTTAVNKFAAAAAAVSKLSTAQLAEGVQDLQESPEDAPDALLSLQAGANRVNVLVSAGSGGLVKDSQLGKTCQALLKHCLEGRELGPYITSRLLHVSNMRLLWQLATIVSAPDTDAAAVAEYVQQRSAFAKVLEALMESGATERLSTPEQLLAGQWWSAGKAGSTVAGSSQVPADLAEKLSVGLETLQDVAVILLGDLVFVENGTGVEEQQQQQQQAGGSRSRAAAGAAAFRQFTVSSSVLERLWRYCCDLLEREAPDVGDDDDAADEDPIEDNDEDVFDDYDAESIAARRTARAAARHNALAAAACTLESLQHRVLCSLSRLLAYRVLPEPGFSWLLSRIITLLDGYGPQAAASTRSLLVHLKSNSRDGGLVTHLVEGLTLLYDQAQELHGEEDTAAAAAGGHKGDRKDTSSWAHVAAVSSKLAGIFQGHNLSQLVLGSLMDKGLAWALEEPFSRAAFPLVCLAPFLSKLSPSEAERVAAALSQRLDDLELDQQEEQGGEVSAQQLEAFLSNLKERAAGIKITRGVLKTPGKAAAAAAAAAAADDDDLDMDADADGAAPAAAATGGKSTGKAGRRKGSRIRFAVDDEPTAAADDDDGDNADQAGAARGRRPSKQPRKSPAAAKRGAARGDDGWIAKQNTSPDSGDKGTTPQQKQQQRRQRQPPRQRQQEQQQQPASEDEPEYEVQEEDEEDAVAEEAVVEEPQQPRRGGRQARCQKAAAAPAAAAPVVQSQGRRRHLQQQQSQQEQYSDAAASEEFGDSDGAAAGGQDYESLQAHSQEEEEQEAAAAAAAAAVTRQQQRPRRGRQQQQAPEFFSAEQLPTGGRSRRQQQPHSTTAAAASADAHSEDEEMPDAADAAAEDSGDDLAGSGLGLDLLATSRDDEGDDDDLMTGGGGGGGDSSEGGAEGGYDSDDDLLGTAPMSQASLPSLQVVIDDLPDDDGEEVDEPPPTRRHGRRR